MQNERIHPDAIEATLERIRNSTPFQRTTRPAAFLNFVTRAALRNGGPPPSEADIAKEVFGRPDFDPRLDPIVRVEAARLRKRLEEYYAGPGAQDEVQIRLPARGYLPEFIQRNGHPPSANGLRLAILPATNLSQDPALDSFCAGLTEEVIAAATDLPDIAVIARTSATVYEGEPVDIRAVGQSLGVTHVLESSVRRGDEQLRVTATLADAASGFTVWSTTLERPENGDAMHTQAEFGTLIASTLAERQDQALAASS